MAGAGAVAGVLVYALGARIAAVGPRGDVVGLAGPPAVARVGSVALAGRGIPAGGPDCLEPVVVAGPGAFFFFLVGTLGARLASLAPRGSVVGLAGPRAVAGIGAVALAGRGIAARG